MKISSNIIGKPISKRKGVTITCHTNEFLKIDVNALFLLKTGVTSIYFHFCVHFTLHFFLYSAMKLTIFFVLSVVFYYLNFVDLTSCSDCKKPLMVMRINKMNIFNSYGKLRIIPNYQYLTNLNTTDLIVLNIQLIVIGLILVTILWYLFLHTCADVKYIRFDVNLDIYKKKSTSSLYSHYFTSYFICSMIGILLITHINRDLRIPLIIQMTSSFPDILSSHFLSKLYVYNKTISTGIFNVIPMYIFFSSCNLYSHILSILVFQIWSARIIHSSYWLQLILIIMSNDVELNPGPYFQNSFLSFMSWNLNSLTKNNFERVRLLEAHNSIFKYDIISVNETNLNNAVEIPEPLMNDDYTFISANNSSNKKRGGVGIFYKNSLPVVIRNDLSFGEAIVIELRFGRKKNIFYSIVSKPIIFTKYHRVSTFC